MTPTFQGEVQFRRWSDSSTQGVQVTFALPDSDSLEPLKHKAGKRFMAVLVEIGDDEMPVQPAPKKDQRGPLCREACDYCAMPDFQRWAHEAADFQGEPSEESAKDAILGWIGIESRRELDESPQAGRLFVERVRLPFMKWQRARLHSAAKASAGY